MNSFCRFIKTLLMRFRLNNLSVLLIPLFLIIMVFAACTNSEDFANPLDSANLRTAGSPANLTLYPGDKQVRVTWSEPAEEGIKAYKIYRRSTTDPEEPFKLVATVDAPASEFVDKQNIENDRRDSDGRILPYEYRISYIDINDIETPDPANPPNITEEPLRVWQTATVTPSIAPPTPVLTIGELSDLTVPIFWQDYVIPPDFSMFRIETAWDHEDGKPLIFRTVAEISMEHLQLQPQPQSELFYIDLKYPEDNFTKMYRVTAVDEFGVEASATISGTSPNLPPAPPKNFKATIYLRPFSLKYDVTFTWDRNRELDLDGYWIYSQGAEENPRPRLKLGKNKKTATLNIEPPSGFTPLSYFITAFDDSRRPDGTLDESEIIEAIYYVE